MDKCEVCPYECISDILLYDYIVQKCSRCEFIRISASQYSELLYKVMHSLNVGQIKSYTTLGEVSKKSAREMEKFIKVAELSSFKPSTLGVGVCNVCRSSMCEVTNSYFSHFKMYYCLGCNSVYFKKEDFLEFTEFLSGVVKPFSLIDFIKEIFHWKVKDSAKEQAVQPKLLHKENP